MSDLSLHCGTRLVRSAVQAVLGCDSLRVAGNFNTLRARFNADTTNGTLWHALFEGRSARPDSIPKAATLARSGGCQLTTYPGDAQELLAVGAIKSSTAFKALCLIGTSPVCWRKGVGWAKAGQAA